MYRIFWPFTEGKRKEENYEMAFLELWLKSDGVTVGRTELLRSKMWPNTKKWYV